MFFIYMNKSQRQEYKAEVISFSKFWTAMSTVLALVSSVWVVVKFQGNQWTPRIILLTLIIYCMVWTLVYITGIVWSQMRAYRRALKY